jgi:hypothetical protein
MRRNLVDERQVFGNVKNEICMPGQGKPAEHFNHPGSTSPVENNGRTVVESFGDKNPGAHAEACKGLDNPFWPTGHPKMVVGNIKYNEPERGY